MSQGQLIRIGKGVPGRRVRRTRFWVDIFPMVLLAFGVFYLLFSNRVWMAH